MVRFVDWDEQTQWRANVAANNAYLAGEFTDDLRGILSEISDEQEELYQALRLNDLATSRGWDVPDFQPVSVDEQGRLDEVQKKTCPNCGYEF